MLLAAAAGVAAAGVAAADAAASVAGAADESSSPGSNPCTDSPGPVALGSAQWNGWGRSVDNTRYQPEPAIRATDVEKLTLKWAFGYPGAVASAQPTIVDGRVFAASATGRVYSLDAKTGCTYWSYEAQAGVRTAISIAELAPARLPKRPARSKRSRHRLTNAHLEVQKPPSAAFFGDEKGTVYALDAENGTLLWKTPIDPHPTARIEGSPTLYQDRLYVAVGSSEESLAADPTYACCTFRGSVAALDIATGRVLWKTYTVSEEPRPDGKSASGAQEFAPAGVPISAAPTIDASRGVLYVATGRSYTANEQPLADAVMALDLVDGKVRWAKQLSAEGAAELGSSPILRSLASGKQVLLIGQRSGVVSSLDPDRAGEILWETKAGENKADGGVDQGAAADHRSVYVALGGLAADPANQSGSLTALDIRTGAKRWRTDAPTPSCSWGGDEPCGHGEAQAVTVIPGVAFSGSEDGHLRAYSTIDGKILWDYDTARDFVTVNRVKASGGSLHQGGPTIVNGVLYVNSGSGSGRPGNVLLAFSVDGK